MTRMEQTSRQTNHLGSQLLRGAQAQWIVAALSWLIVGLGIILRVAQYAFNRSLWLDEAYLALNITQRSFAELLQPLDYDQGAPIGFLMIERLLVELFGSSEYVLRLFPLLCSLAALLLVLAVARRTLPPVAALVGVLLFATSDRLIYYASEVKQYSSDVAVALLLTWMAVRITHHGLTPARVVTFGLVGAAALWLSHPALFVLAGVGLSLLVPFVLAKDWKRSAWLSVAFALWGLSLAVCYVVSLRQLSANDYLRDYWASREGFMPLLPTSAADVKWFIETFFDVFRNPGGLEFSAIASFAWITGVIVLMRERRMTTALLLSPIILTLIASALHLYPFADRLILFIVPALLLIVGAGAGYLYTTLRHNSAKVAYAFMALLCVPTLFQAAIAGVQPRTFEEIKPVMQYVKDRMQPDDRIYVYYSAQYAFKFYQDEVGFQNNEYSVGVESRADLHQYVADLERLRGNARVWVIFSHTYTNRGMDEVQFFLFHLDAMGERLDAFTQPRAAAFLYDLSNSVAGAQP